MTSFSWCHGYDAHAIVRLRPDASFSAMKDVVVAVARVFAKSLLSAAFFALVGREIWTLRRDG